VNGEANKADTRLAGIVELVIKGGTLTVALLYVLGLLVTNTYLMGLGIADYSALEGRFVLSGALFLLYAFLMLSFPSAILAPPVGVFVTMKGSSIKVRLFVTALTLLFSLWLGVVLYGTILGDLYPWGISYEEQLQRAVHPSWSNYREDLVRSVGYLREAFLHPKTVVGMLEAYVLGAIVLANRSLRKNRPILIGFAVSAVVAGGTITMVGYAQSVFPNLPYNLGGGQPRIIRLHSRPKEQPAEPRRVVAAEDLDPSALFSDRLALWHQDASFVYVTPVTPAPGSDALLMAVAAADIASIEYLRGYVKVKSGAQIDTTSLDPAPPPSSRR